MPRRQHHHRARLRCQHGGPRSEQNLLFAFERRAADDDADIRRQLCSQHGRQRTLAALAQVVLQISRHMNSLNGSADLSEPLRRLRALRQKERDLRQQRPPQPSQH